jgi:hypothetical protein
MRPAASDRPVRCVHGSTSSAHTGGEKESLHVSLDRHRDVVVWKLEGLDDT